MYTYICILNIMLERERDTHTKCRAAPRRELELERRDGDGARRPRSGRVMPGRPL